MCQGTPAKTGQTTPLICGENAGQHIYIDAGAYSTSSATFALTMTGSTARSWKIKVFASYANFDCIVLFGGAGLPDRVFLPDQATRGVYAVPYRQYWHGRVCTYPLTILQLLIFTG